MFELIGILFTCYFVLGFFISIVVCIKENSFPWFIPIALFWPLAIYIFYLWTKLNKENGRD